MNAAEASFERIPLQWRKFLAVLAMLALAVYILRQVGPILHGIMQVIGPFLIGGVIAYVFYPIVRFVQKKLRLGRAAGILFLAGLICLVLGGVLLWLVPVLYEQFKAAFNNLMDWIARLVDLHGAQYLGEETAAMLRETLEGDRQYFRELARRFFMRVDAEGAAVAQGSMFAVRNVAGGVVLSLGTLIGFFATLSLVIVITFFMLMDMEATPGIIRKLLPQTNRDRIWEIMLKADMAVGGFLRGQLTVCVLIGFLMSVLLFIIGMKEYAILIGFASGLLNFVPYLGPISGLVPGILWLLLSGGYEDWGERGVYLGVLGVGFILIQLIEGFVFQPFIVGNKASLHPLTVIFALVIGSQAGLAGMIVAVPLAAVAKVVWVELFWKHRADPDEMSDSTRRIVESHPT